MEALRTLQVRISGKRNKEPLRPNSLDIDELIKALEHSRDLITPEGKSRPDIHVQVEEGSVLLKLTTAAMLVISTQALLEEVQRTYNKAILAPKQAKALSYFTNLAQKEDFEISFGGTTSKTALRINKGTQWADAEEEVWVDTEHYITGKITSLGGKIQPNVHVETGDPQFGTLIVQTSEAFLASDDKNRLYKQQTLRIRIRQNIASGTYDLKSATLLQFIDPTSAQKAESEAEYLDRLIAEATPHWASAGDPDAWLKSVRGYE